MQMYPSDDYAQHCYTGVPDDEEDYHYNNNNAFVHQGMLKPLEKGVPHRKQNYMWDDNYGKDEYSYNGGGSNLQMKPNHQWIPPQKHDYNYNNMHGYGGYDHNFENFKHRHEDYSSAQYSGEWYQSEEGNDNWNERSDHFGLGKHQMANKYSGMPYGVEKGGGYGTHQGLPMPYGVEKGGGYGAHQGPHMPFGAEKGGGYGAHQQLQMLMAKQHPYHVPAAQPIWHIKSIKD